MSGARIYPDPRSLKEIDQQTLDDHKSFYIQQHSGEHLFYVIITALQLPWFKREAATQDDWCDTRYEAVLKGLDYFVPQIHHNAGEQHVDRFYGPDGEEY